MNLVFTLTFSIIFQLVMTVTFFKEALTTKQGVYCRTKCASAAMLYLFFAILLTWFLAGKALS